MLRRGGGGGGLVWTGRGRVKIVGVLLGEGWAERKAGGGGGSWGWAIVKARATPGNNPG